MSLYQTPNKVTKRYCIPKTDIPRRYPIREATGEQLYKHYADVPQDIFTQIITSDPSTKQVDGVITYTGKYSKWLLKLYKANKLPLEDLYQATEYLEIYIKHQAKIPQGQRDVNKYRTLPELYVMLNGLGLADALTKSEMRDEIHQAKDDVVLVYEDDKYICIKPETHEASVYWGRNSRWCTATDSDSRPFNHYDEEVLYYIIVKQVGIEPYLSKKKYNLYLDTERVEIADIDNRHIDLTDVCDEISNEVIVAIFKDLRTTPVTDNDIFYLLIEIGDIPIPLEDMFLDVFKLTEYYVNNQVQIKIDPDYIIPELMRGDNSNSNYWDIFIGDRLLETWDTESYNYSSLPDPLNDTNMELFKTIINRIYADTKPSIDWDDLDKGLIDEICRESELNWMFDTAIKRTRKTGANDAVHDEMQDCLDNLGLAYDYDAKRLVYTTSIDNALDDDVRYLLQVVLGIEGKLDEEEALEEFIDGETFNVPHYGFNGWDDDAYQDYMYDSLSEALRELNHA